jgi:cell division inhibitor SulA
MHSTSVLEHIMTTATPKTNQETRLAALEQARALSESLRAARVAQDVDVVTLLHQMREARDAELSDSASSGRCLVTDAASAQQAADAED